MSTRVLLEFSGARAMTRAESTLRSDDWRIEESFSPTPVDDAADISEALHPRSIPIAALCGGLLGGIGCLAFEYYAAVFDYAIDVGGRPMDSTIAFIPAALETSLLGAAIGVVVAFLFAARLPRFHHPLFDVESFAQASDNRYFLIVERNRANGDASSRKIMAATGAIAVHEVGRDA